MIGRSRLLKWVTGDINIDICGKMPVGAFEV